MFNMRSPYGPGQTTGTQFGNRPDLFRGPAQAWQGMGQPVRQGPRFMRPGFGGQMPFGQQLMMALRGPQGGGDMRDVGRALGADRGYSNRGAKGPAGPGGPMSGPA